MKSIFKIMFVLSFAGLSAQSVSDYKYVYVPKKFKDFKTNNAYNLNKILSLKLGDKNYRVVNDLPEEWPEELQQDKCSVLMSEVLNDSNMLKNRVKLDFTDCNGKVVLSIPATGDYKEFDKGFQDALVKAIARVPVSADTRVTLPVAKTEPAAKVENITQEQAVPVNTVQKGTSVNSASTENRAEIFKNGNVAFNKVKLSPTQFIFTNSNSSVPFATFRESTKSGVYRVQLENGIQTLGYDEGNKLVVEIPQNDGSYRKEEFIRQ